MRALRPLLVGMLSGVALGDYTNNILITGYWPPTNEMVRRFSTNPDQNPDGWIGGNWEGRGYDVHSYFAEYPWIPHPGEGDFMVDYQDTSYDFWRVTEELRPVAIITFGLAENDRDWELEGGHRNWPWANWQNDYIIPRRPTDDLPIFWEPENTVRNSTLPLQDIVDAVEDAVPSLDPYFTPMDDSNFLCNFIGYHAAWYHDLHASPDDPYWNVAAGHIHVGGAMTLEEAILATDATLRALITYVDGVVPEPASGLLLAAALVVWGRRRGRSAA